MIGTLKIYMLITKPGSDIGGNVSNLMLDSTPKRTCIAKEFMERCDCEAYMQAFRELNGFQKHEIYALWSATDAVRI